METLIIVLIILWVLTSSILIWVVLYYQNKERIQNATRIITDKPEPIHRVTIDGVIYKCLVHPSDCKHRYETVKNGLTKIKVCLGCGLTKDEVKKYIEESNLHCDHVYLPTAEGMELSTGYYACIKCGLLIDKETYKEYSHAVR